jgi:hypothetical protein
VIVTVVVTFAISIAAAIVFDAMPRIALILAKIANHLTPALFRPDFDFYADTVAGVQDIKPGSETRFSVLRLAAGALLIGVPRLLVLQITLQIQVALIQIQAALIWRRATTELKDGLPLGDTGEVGNNDSNDPPAPARALPGPAVGVRMSILQAPRTYAPEPTMTAAERQVVLLSRYSFKSQIAEAQFHLSANTVQIGIRFKNVGPTVIRWEMETFEVSMSTEPAPIVIYLTNRGTLGAQEDMLFQGPLFGNLDHTMPISGRVLFSAMYGPPQRPRAFRSKEVWQVEILPEGDIKYTTRAYKVNESEEELEH